MKKQKYILDRGVVWDDEGNTIGYRCDECGKIVKTMLGDTCNQCVATERRHREIVEAIKSLKPK